MHVTTNMLNNSKEDLYKMSTQFASGRVYPDDTASAMEELSLVENLSTADTHGKIKNHLDEKLKVEVVKTVLNTLGSMTEVLMSITTQCTSESLVVEALITLLESEMMRAKIGEMEEKMQVIKEHPTLAVIRANNEDRNGPSFTVENGELCYNGVPVHSGTFDDSEKVNVVSDTAFDSPIKSVFTLEFGTDENGMSNKLSSLLGDITADISGGDMSNMEAYLEELSAYKDLLLSVQVDLEHEDPAVAITKYKNQEGAYQACLAMQPIIFQPTLLDYVS